MKKGLVYVFTGNGKGKTSAAFWTGVRAALRGMKVAAIQWYKEGRWPTAEQEIAKLFSSSKSSLGSTRSTDSTSSLQASSGQADSRGSFKVYLMGKGFYKLPTDHATSFEHKKAAQEALGLARRIVGKVDVLILDEVNNAVKDKLIDLIDLIDLISKRGKTHIILTGRGGNKKIIGTADLVTEMKKIKHPFDKGKMAVKGLDF